MHTSNNLFQCKIVYIVHAFVDAICSFHLHLIFSTAGERIKTMSWGLTSENSKGRDYSEDLDADGKIVLEWILGK
jgi:hypothetical protein